MAKLKNSRASCTVSLLFFTLIIQQVNCWSGFRVYRTEAELQEFEQLSPQERLERALVFPGAEIVEITGANQAATVQEGVSLYLDCSPWLQQFPGGSIQWYSLQLDEFGNIAYIPQSHIPIPEVEGLCSVVVWDNCISQSPVSCEDILGYDVRLYHPESKHQNLTRRIEMDKTFHKISDEDKGADINHETHVQVRIAHKHTAGRWSEGTPIGCEKPTETPSGMYFELNNKIYLNNSALPLRDVGEGDRALLCKTDRKDCCGTPPNRYGEFYYPNGVAVPIASRQQGFYRNRGEQVIRLNRRSTATTLTGKYRCAIPGIDGEIQNIYVTLTNWA